MWLLRMLCIQWQVARQWTVALNPFCAQFIPGEIKDIFAFGIISQNLDSLDTTCWKRNTVDCRYRAVQHSMILHMV